MILITGESALSWWNTPAIFKDNELTPEQYSAFFGTEGPASPFRHNRTNMRKADGRILSRILFDLKGIPLPIEVAIDHGNIHESALIRPRRLTKKPDSSHLVSLGDNLYVARPPLALAQAAHNSSLHKVLMLMFEACGLYAEPVTTPLIQPLLDECIKNAKDATNPSQCYRKDEDDSWEPALNRKKEYTGIWKRSPLVSADELRLELAELSGIDGLPLARRATQFVLGRSGSWLESAWALIAFLPPRYGGAGYPAPLLSEKVTFTPEAKELANMPYCICDMLWQEQKAVLELNGKGFHSSRDGFKEASGRRTALEYMGYNVLEITYGQVSDMEQMESMLRMMTTRLGLNPSKQSAKQVKQRAKLHEFLFG